MGVCLFLGTDHIQQGRDLFFVLEKHLLYDSCPSLLQFLSSGDLDASASPASRPFCIFVQDCCFVAFAWFRFPDKIVAWRSCVRSEKEGQYFLTLCSLTFRLTWEIQPTPTNLWMRNNARGTWACLIS